MTQKKPKLGVLALMLEDYLPLFPGIDRAQTAYVNEVLDGLRDAAEFVFPHAAMNRAQIESLVAQYNHEKLDGILILLLTYSQGAYLVRALEENHLPLALALIQPEQTVRPDFIEWDYTVNQGIHGSQDQANVMTRMGVNCVYYAGNRCDGSFVRFVADFGRAAMTVRAMKRMRIGVIGKLPGMGDVITDDMAIYRFLGPELVYDSIGTVRRFCAEVEEDAVRAQMDADRAVFELDPTLDEPTHAEAARMYLGLRAYLQSGGLSGYTLHYGECGEDGRFTQLPLLAASNLLADGYGYAAEGDSTAAVLVAAMQTLCGAAGFTEMYMMDFKREAILMCHQGEGNWRLCRADRRPYLKKQSPVRGRAFQSAHADLHAGAGPRVHPVADASDGGPLPAGLRAGRDPAGRGSAARGYAVSVLPAGQRRAQLCDVVARTGRHTPRGARPGRPARPHPPVLPPLEC